MQAKEGAQKKEDRRLKWLVRTSAAIVCVLLVIFFAVVIRSDSVIKGEVEHVKDGPYPMSVAAGHIETNLFKLEAVIEHMTTTRLVGDAENNVIGEAAIDTIETQVQAQIDIICGSITHTTERIEQFQKDYDLLTKRLSVFTTMCWHNESGPASYEQVRAYAEDYLSPLVSSLENANQKMLDQATDEVNAMYDHVNEAIATMLVFSMIMLISVIVMIAIYMVMINLKTRFENQLRETLNHATIVANEANEAKSAFLANMSHDIRTPMNAIVGLTTIASENIDDSLRVKQCLTRIATSSQHLLSLINDVLDMNKIESGKVVLTQEEFSIKELADEIDTIFHSQPAARQRNKEVVLENVEHDILIGDMMRLRQILLNLTSNALKYTNDGDVTRMIIRQQPSARPGHVLVTFVVEDTGIGMKREFVERIFEPFERERNDFINFTEGTGLGMAITKNLVELMDGTIKVDSELGKGTTVTIQAEFAVAPENSVRREKVVREGKVPVGLLGKRVRGNVLIVEDNEINMEIATQLLQSRGATVDGATDGIDALAKVSDSKEGQYDLIFMDMQMPKMNGIEATRAIRKFLSDHARTQIPIVAMTANAFDSDRERALEAGMDDFMAKPINIRQLEEMLARYLECDGSADATAGGEGAAGEAAAGEGKAAAVEGEVAAGEAAGGEGSPAEGSAR